MHYTVKYLVVLHSGKFESQSSYPKTDNQKEQTRLTQRNKSQFCLKYKGKKEKGKTKFSYRNVEEHCLLPEKIFIRMDVIHTCGTEYIRIDTMNSCTCFNLET